MLFSAADLSAVLAHYFAPFVRIAAVFSIAPFWGSYRIPVRVRLLLALSITSLVVQQPMAATYPDPLSAAMVLQIAQQIVIGLAIGLMIALVIAAFVMAAEVIAGTMGLGFAMMTDPQANLTVPVLGQFFSVLATLLFLALQGHLAVLGLVVESFEVLPLHQGLSPESLERIVNAGSMLFLGAIKIALPALVTMLSINLVMGVMTRSAPQLNIFSIGFPLTLVTGFIVLILTLPGFTQALEGLLLEAMNRLDQLLLMSR